MNGVQVYGYTNNSKRNQQGRKAITMLNGILWDQHILRKTRLADFFSGFSHQSKGMYLMLKTKNEDHMFHVLEGLEIFPSPYRDLQRISKFF